MALAIYKEPVDDGERNQWGGYPLVLKVAILDRTGCLTRTVTFAASETFSAFPGRSFSGVRRAKAAFLSGCESHPAILLQPREILTPRIVLYCLA